MSSWSRLIRFTPQGSTTPQIGEPVSPEQDVGLATYKGEKVEVNLYSGHSILDPGTKTGEKATVGKLLSVLKEEEVGSIRCIGLNYVKHAEEAKIALPSVPVLFMKPSTALNDPYPSKVIMPKFTKEHNSSDWESELGVIIGKDAKNVSEEDALEYVLGYTATNDVSSRKTQMEQSQWCFSKGFDGACPIGPTIVSTSTIPDPSKLQMRGLLNGKVMQQSGLDDLYFSVPKIVSFLSQGTTLKAGTLILTGTPHGVGFAMKPPVIIDEGDEFRVEVLPHIGTLINVFEWEK
ncbi:hypothetical protein T439DRAFT_328493 [Meredithblackwellia eburnea MCA 4105]